MPPRRTPNACSELRKYIFELRKYKRAAEAIASAALCSFSYNFQSIDDAPCACKNVFVCENGLLPKKPR